MTDNAAPHNAAHWAPDQQAGGPGLEPLGEHEHPTHDDHGHHNDPESVAKEMRKYWVVFFALGVLTIITVAISYIDLPTWGAIALALVVASVKGTLVAAVFMHLISERKLVYAVLAITVLFFAVLLWGPWHHRRNAADVWPNYDTNATSPDNPQQTGTHTNAPPQSTPAQH